MVFRLLKEQKAVGFIGKARAPTVTMPRLKALTAGSPPVFLDLLTNIEADGAHDSALPPNPSSFTQDTWIRQMTRAKKSLVFYGDDTWLRLFPGQFSRYEGTHSFFVTDTVHVDLNVTRHLDGELDPVAARPWDALILHYLGLDHVGHTEGAAGPKMAPKQREMDKVVETIYRGISERDRLEGRRTLMVLLGDHGMTEQGNHGGASPAETDTALLFISPHLEPARIPIKVQEVDQVDLVPTLSLLLGLPIPKESTGRAISRMLRLAAPDRMVSMLLENIAQLERLLGGKFDDLENFDLDTLEADLEYLKEDVNNRIGSYNTYRMAIGIFIGFTVMLCICGLIFSNVKLHYLLPLLAMLSIVADISMNHARLSKLAALCFAAGMLATFIKMPRSTEKFNVSLMLLGAGVLVYAGLQQSSSYIEEEHYFWYGFFPLLVCLQALSNLNSNDNSNNGSNDSSSNNGRLTVPRTVLVLGIFRILTLWNAVGFQEQSRPDFRLFLSLNPNLSILCAMVGLAALFLCWLLYMHPSGKTASVWAGKIVADLGFGSLIYLIWRYKVMEIRRIAGGSINIGILSDCFDPSIEISSDTWTVTLPRLIYGGFAVTALWMAILDRWTGKRWQPIILSSNNATSSWSLLLTTLLLVFLQKPHNLVPVLGILALVQLVGKLCQGPPSILQWSLKVSLIHACYFILGPSNLISSVDFSNAYAGMGSFHLVPVALIAFTITWSGPILASFALISANPGIILLLLGWRSVVQVAVMLCLWIQRDHISVWTVFAPRLLFEYGWTVFYTIILLVFCLFKRNKD